MKILVINAGSSSLKYQLFNMRGEKILAKGICERIGLDGRISGTTSKGRSFEYDVVLNNHTRAFMEVEKVLTQGDAKVINSLSEISAVGHRIVQGGSIFNKSVLVTEEVIAGIENLIDLAPLHNAAHLQGIQACRHVLGEDVPQVVVFDNAFHSTMPPEVYTFAVPYEYYEKYNLRKYGFHGTSHRFVSQRCADVMKRDIKDLKIITCHLGNGCSITAVMHGQVLDTSMGLTPLDGFIMGTRSGGIDPSAVLYLQEKEGWTPHQTDEVLNKKSGMLGVSGISSDDRDILKAERMGNKRAALARKMQRYQIRKFIGSYVAAMDGVDAIVFTGGIGENTIDLRASVCNNLSFLGIKIDEEMNKKLIRGKEGELSTPESKVRVFVLPTNEELVIARDTKAIVEAMK
ncbi:MAG TPA: acetate kinase [Clostridiales bacterium]|nr:MAG: Acetate kinase [Firmicutes bacterium ADurb.Bin262]HOU10445.1 acetate kinase [Clostridiales bacterium]